MATCLERLNNTLIGNTTTTWGELDRVTLLEFIYTTYLRPDDGGALFPWAYTILFLIIHLPVVLIRVARFDLVQYFCIGSAILAVYLTIQEYVSTDFAAAKVLVWNPLLLVIDAGAMLQVFFLVIEGVSVKVGKRTIVMEQDDAPKDGVLPQNRPLTQSIRSVIGGLRRRIISTRSVSNTDEANELQNLENQEDNVPLAAEDGDVPSSVPAILAAVFSAILFITIVVLQILGLQAAFRKHNADGPPPVTWCSPSFQPFGMVVMDGDCNIYQVDPRGQQGIGCITLQGQWQQDWLYISGIGIIICLVFEFVDMLILFLVNGKSKVREVKMKRPWTTMIIGLIVLGMTFFYGYQYAQTLPPGITDKVLVVIDAGGLMAFEANLVTAGLRGTLLGWTDGLFKSWGKAYFGS